MRNLVEWSAAHPSSKSPFSQSHQRGTGSTSSLCWVTRQSHDPVAQPQPAYPQMMCARASGIRSPEEGFLDLGAEPVFWEQQRWVLGRCVDGFCQRIATRQEQFVQRKLLSHRRLEAARQGGIADRSTLARKLWLRAAERHGAA